MPQTVNPIAAVLIFAFLALIVLARFVRRKPSAGTSAQTDPSLVWMTGDVGRQGGAPADQPVMEAMDSAESDQDDPGAPDAADGGGDSGGSGGGDGGSN
jgi:hypothetical protein